MIPIPGIDEIRAAAERIQGSVRRTPLLAAAPIKEGPELVGQLRLKLEALQVTRLVQGARRDQCGFHPAAAAAVPGNRYRLRRQSRARSRLCGVGNQGAGDDIPAPLGSCRQD